MTYSIGFRAPSITNFLVESVEDLSLLISGEMLYKDRLRNPVTDPGLVDGDVIPWIHESLSQLMGDQELMERLFCLHLSKPGSAFIPEEMDSVSDEMITLYRQNTIAIERYAAAFLVYRRFNTCTRLYAAGVEYELPLELTEFAQLITGREKMDQKALKPYWGSKKASTVLRDLIERGVLHFTSDHG